MPMSPLMSRIKRRSASNSFYGRNSSSIFGAKIQIQSCNCSLFTTLKEKTVRRFQNRWRGLTNTVHVSAIFVQTTNVHHLCPSSTITWSLRFWSAAAIIRSLVLHIGTRPKLLVLSPVQCSSFTQEFNNTQGSFTVYMSCNQFRSAAYKSSSVIILTHVPSIYPWHSQGLSNANSANSGISRKHQGAYVDSKDFVFNKSKTNCTRPSVHYNKEVCPRLEVHHFYFIALVFLKYTPENMLQVILFTTSRLLARCIS